MAKNASLVNDDPTRVPPAPVEPPDPGVAVAFRKWGRAANVLAMKASTFIGCPSSPSFGELPSITRKTLASVWINTISGAAGSSSYTNGIMTNPVDGLADAKTIADNLKLKKFYIQNQSSLTLAATYSGYVFEGQEWTLALGGQAIANAVIIGATVSGIATGASPTFADCHIGTVTLAAGTDINNSDMTGTLTMGSAGIFSLHNCLAESTFILDFGAAGGASTANLADFKGFVEVRNMLAGDVLNISGEGAVTIAASCTAGTVSVWGSFGLALGHKNYYSI